MRKFITYADRVHPVHLPRVLVETAVAHGAPRLALFEDTELTDEMLTSPDMRMSYQQWALFIRNALLHTKNPALGLAVGKNTGFSQLGVLGFLIQNSPTIGAAFEACCRYGQGITPGWEFSLDVTDDVATLTIDETLPMDPFRVFAVECVLSSFDAQARALLRRPVPVRRVFLPFPEPAHAHVYRDQFHDVEYVFNAARAAVEFDASILSEPIAFADPATAQLAERYCAQLLPPDPSMEGLVAQVRRLLDAASGPPPSLNEIARSLQTSSRSLRRELQNMGTSYTDLLDDSRRARAEQWMRTSSMPFERLATQLGFSHVRSFRRAYKRWTGHTPGSQRARAH
ncbi:MAG TPA: AraC family transcriptional regulator [Polyangiaceae bacterium]|nr:AraC family transcriptional regulator [Polyangiaceae bacterium]